MDYFDLERWTINDRRVGLYLKDLSLYLPDFIAMYDYEKLSIEK